MNRSPPGCESPPKYPTNDERQSKTLKGLPDGVKLVGIDQRPSNGDLYGVGDDSVVYEISENAKADAVGDGFGNPQVMPIVSPGAPLDGKSFAVDFNPVPDAIRIVPTPGRTCASHRRRVT